MPRTLVPTWSMQTTLFFPGLFSPPCGSACAKCVLWQGSCTDTQHLARRVLGHSSHSGAPSCSHRGLGAGGHRYRYRYGDNTTGPSCCKPVSRAAAQKASAAVPDVDMRVLLG